MSTLDLLGYYSITEMEREASIARKNRNVLCGRKLTDAESKEINHTQLEPAGQCK